MGPRGSRAEIHDSHTLLVLRSLGRSWELLFWWLDTKETMRKPNREETVKSDTQEQ